MKIDNEAARFAEQPHAILSTINPNGTPHLVPIVFTVVGDQLFSAVDWKPKTTQKLHRIENIRADPAVGLLVDHYDDDWTQLWWIRADGNAHIAEGDSSEGRHAIDALVQKYPKQYADNRPPGPVIVVENLSFRSWTAS